jgi:OHCU decarboxylase
MMGERPFDSFDDMKARASLIWNALKEPEFDEAFRAHPRIGEKKAEAHQSVTAKTWSKSEQSKVDDASEAVRAELREINKAYEEKFGRIYIVCATGKSAEEMLAIAKERLNDPPDVELKRAAEEQRKITELRLEKMVRE